MKSMQNTILFFMKTKMIIMFLLLSYALSAQQQRRMSKEELIGQKWEFMVQKADLKASNMSKVQPLFMEFEMQVWDLYDKNREIFRAHRRRGAGEKVDFEPINEAYVNLEIEKAQLQKSYYLKLKKVVDAETINKLLNAERVYRRDLIQSMPERARTNP